MGALPPPVPLAALNDARLGLLPPPVWPAQGAETIFAFTETGTDLGALPGWAKLAGLRAAVVAGNNSLSFNADAGTTAGMYAYDTGDRRHYVETDLKAVTANGMPICVRVLDENNFIGLQITNTTTLSLKQNLAGTITTLASKTVAGSLTNRTYRVEARADNTIAVYHRDELVLTATCPAALENATKVGVYVRETGTEMVGGSGNLTNGGPGYHVYAGERIHGHAQGAWCWFGEPRAISAEGKTWFSTTKAEGIPATNGLLRVTEINHATGVTTSYTLANGTTWIDDHNNAALLIRPDGRLIAFYTGHIDTTGIRFRVSVNPHDASAWGAEQVFAVNSTGSGTTYASVAMLSAESNKVYVFFRGPTTDLYAITSTNLAISTAPTADGEASGTATWGTQAIWVTCINPTDKAVYHKVWSDGVDRIDILMTDAVLADQGPKVDIRHAYWKGGALRATDGRSLGAFPIPFNSTTAVATSGAPDNLGDVWVWDLSRDPSSGIIQAVFTRFITPTDHRYYYARWDGQAWSKTQIPGTSSTYIVHPTSAEHYYSPGVVLDGTKIGVVYASIGDTWKSALYRYVTPDGGLTWTRTRISPDSIAGAHHEGENVRPVVPRNRDPRCGVLWMRGQYGMFVATFGSYHTEMMSART